VQINEQVYIVFQVIKQVDKKVEIYYKQILKLANSLQHKVNDIIFTTFFRTTLLPYLHIVIARMKHDILRQHKEVVATCEESIGDAQNYLELPQTLRTKKPTKGRKNEIIFRQCKKTKSHEGKVPLKS
jgi:hypothetical protein